MLYASLTPRDGRVSVCLATGGHPLPLVLRAGGTVETVGAPGSLVGILDDAGASPSSRSSSNLATRSCWSPTG